MEFLTLLWSSICGFAQLMWVFLVESIKFVLQFPILFIPMGISLIGALIFRKKRRI